MNQYGSSSLGVTDTNSVVDVSVCTQVLTLLTQEMLTHNAVGLDKWLRVEMT